jgi:hypothetical protein
MIKGFAPRHEHRTRCHGLRLGLAWPGLAWHGTAILVEILWDIA